MSKKVLAFVDGVHLKNGVGIPPYQKTRHLYSHLCIYYGHGMASINNEMTTPRSVHDVTTLTENLAGFIISDLLNIR